MAEAQDFLNAAGGYRSLHSQLGKWALHMARVVDTGFSPSVKAVDLLKAAGGEISLYSPFGMWAMRESQRVDASVAGGPVDADWVRQSQVQLSSPYGKFMIDVSEIAP